MHTQFLWIAGLETFKVVKKVQVRLQSRMLFHFGTGFYCSI